MKKTIEIILIILFFLQGSEGLAGATIVLEIAVLVLIVIRKESLKIIFPGYFQLALFVYGFFLLLGIFNNHPNAHIDIKFQLFGFIFYLALLNDSKINILKLLLRINFITILLYIFLYFDIIPNIWHASSVGVKGRLNGPPIIAIILITFLYLHQKKAWDKKYILAFIFGFIYVALTTNFMNLTILMGLTFLLIVNIKKLFKLKFIGLLIIALVSVILYVNSSYAPELLITKATYILDPLEYSSFKIRVTDLKQAILNENFTFFEKIFGKGYGVSSAIYRENKISPSLSKTISFQEIDNGFYYLYHRGGLILVFVFVISHIFLIKKVSSSKARIGFIAIVVITNLLTIHYFNYIFYLVLPFLILSNYQNRNEDEISIVNIENT